MKYVQVQMLKSTLEKIEDMKDALHTDNRSEIVKTSIDVTQIVANTIKRGGRVIVEENGKQRELVIPGIGK